MWKVTTSFVRKVPPSLKPDELKEAIEHAPIFSVKEIDSPSPTRSILKATLESKFVCY